MISEFSKSSESFLKDFKAFITRVVNKIESAFVKVEHFTGNEITLKNNVVHIRDGSNGTTSLTIKYPKGDFVSTIIFTTARSGKIKVNFPESRTIFAGSGVLEFFPAETWELNIHNGRVTGTRLYNLDDTKRLGG